MVILYIYDILNVYVLLFKINENKYELKSMRININ